VKEVITFTLVLAEPITGLSGKRYGEVLLVTPGDRLPSTTATRSTTVPPNCGRRWTRTLLRPKTVLPQRYSTVHGTG
jgi:hypothetical protein